MFYHASHSKATKAKLSPRCARQTVRCQRKRIARSFACALRNNVAITIAFSTKHPQPYFCSKNSSSTFARSAEKTFVFNFRTERKEIYFDPPEIQPSNAILEELETFADAIENDTTPIVPLAHATEALRVAYQIIECF